MTIHIRAFTQQDIDAITASGLDGARIAEGKKVVEVLDGAGNMAELYVDVETIDRLGAEYMSRNVTMEYSKFLEQWYANLSQNEYYNDLQRYPEKIIEVKYVEDKEGEYTEVYKNKETGQLYMRQRTSRENFARWLTCHSYQRYQYTDDNCVRANIIFKNGEQTEKVIYDDWNGNAAYSGTFNPAFRNG